MPSQNREIVHKLFNDLFNKGKLAVADEIIAPNHVHHDPATPDFGKGSDGQKQIVTLYRKAFPDLHFTIDQIIDADDLGAATLERRPSACRSAY
jgi:predicted SnoaL-like aldol condensation-catalyzing enzyme